MKINPAPQGGEDWRRARLGIPTASNFHRIVTPAGKLSEQRKKYMAELLAEWFFGTINDSLDPEDSVRGTGFMDRGTELERDAVIWLFEQGIELERVGLCTTDDEKIGASPDGLIGKDGTAEIKSPGAARVFLYWLQGRPAEYKVQRQGQLWVCERDWSQLAIYHPLEELRQLPPKDGRDDVFIKLLADGVRQFVDELDDAKARLSVARIEYQAARQAESDAQIPAELS